MPTSLASLAPIADQQAARTGAPSTGDNKHPNCGQDPRRRNKRLSTTTPARLTPSLGRLLTYSDAPIVSSDIIGNPASTIFDAPLTAVSGHTVKVLGWYDNEWGFSNRLIDTVELLGRGLARAA